MLAVGVGWWWQNPLIAPCFVFSIHGTLLAQLTSVGDTFSPLILQRIRKKMGIFERLLLCIAKLFVVGGDDPQPGPTAQAG